VNTNIIGESGSLFSGPQPGGEGQSVNSPLTKFSTTYWKQQVTVIPPLKYQLVAALALSKQNYLLDIDFNLLRMWPLLHLPGKDLLATEVSSPDHLRIHLRSRVCHCHLVRYQSLPNGPCLPQTWRPFRNLQRRPRAFSASGHGIPLAAHDRMHSTGYN